MYEDIKNSALQQEEFNKDYPEQGVLLISQIFLSSCFNCLQLYCLTKFIALLVY